MHLKDCQTPANGKENLLQGKGDTSKGQILGLMSKERYSFPVTIELEHKILEGSNAVKEVTRCLEFYRQQLKT